MCDFQNRPLSMQNFKLTYKLQNTYRLKAIFIATKGPSVLCSELKERSSKQEYVSMIKS
jgi:hypothetical protein